jgi:hypothetical protein
MILSTHPEALAASSPTGGSRICHHLPRCPAATAPDRHAARTIAAHPEQGWSLLCNGIILFDDNGELLPDGCTAANLPGVIPHGEQNSATARSGREIHQNSCGYKPSHA